MITKKMSFAFIALFLGLFLAGCTEELLSNSSAPTYTLTSNASPVNGGGVSRNPDKKSYESGTTVTLTAEPNSGYIFAGWTGAPSGVNALDPAITLTVNRDFAVIAYFEAIPAYAVTYSGNENSGGAAPIDAKSPYTYRATVTVLGQGSLAKDGHVFGGWNTAADGNGTNYAADAVFNITGNTTFYARWIPVTQPSHSVTITGTGAGASGSGRYAEGIPVEINAGTVAGKRFVKWTSASGGIAFDDANSAKTTFAMPANDVTVTANFEAVPTYLVTVTSQGIGGAWGGGSYAEGTAVEINAGFAAVGQRFVNWTAEGDGITFAKANSAATSFIMPARAVTVTAVFEWHGPDPYYLGYGYDVINSSYIYEGHIKRLHPVLEQRKMIGDNIIFFEGMRTQEFDMSAGNTLSEFYTARNESLKLGLGASLSFFGILFSGDFKREFGVQTEQSTVKKYRYARGRSYRYTRSEYIGRGNARPEVLKNYLTDGFAADMRSGNEKLILDRYGSHIFIQYYKGGTMEFNFAYYGTELTTSEQLTSALQGSLSAKLQILNIGVSGSVEEKETSIRRGHDLDANSRFNSCIYGGKAIDITSPAAIQSNYSVWMNSIETNENICGIGEFDASFIPVWKLAEASGETELARRLEEEFLARAAEQSGNL